ncbi:MAG TPA: hypothetical protein VNM72_05605 [Blastocatellia bacterium]|nr:hypothetical protein [Blastocatellia bacterium]
MRMKYRMFLVIFVFTLLTPMTQAQRGRPSRPIRGADFEAALVRCSEVTVPTTLSNCGSDPLNWGTASINRQGKVQIKIFGAQPNVIYTAVYRSLDGSTERTLREIRTNATGNANAELTGFFRFNDVGAGTVVLERENLDQFLTGFIIEVLEPDEITQPNLEAGLVRCSEVNQPTTLSSCGTDRLLEGRAEIEQDVGVSEIEVRVAGAEPNTTYDVILRSPDAMTNVPIGTLTTDGRGLGKLEVENFFAPGTVGSGNIVLQRNGLDQFITGFKVSQQTRGRR